MAPVRDRLGGRRLVLDGGLASELERRGADLRDDLWSARLLRDDPALIRQVHLDYFGAGADVATGASYQASFEGFARRGLDREEASALMRRSVALAREAAEEHAARTGAEPIVAASVGPYGAMLADGSEYDGRYGRSVAELADFHRPRFEALLDAGPDVLAIETIPSVLEAEAVVELLAEFPEAEAWVSFSCRDEERLHDGTPFAEAAALASSSDRVVAVGVNCTAPGLVAGLLSRVSVEKALVAYPNLGSTWDAASKTWRAEGPRFDFRAGAAAWRDAGATLIGGCCGTTPADIRAIASASA